MSSRKTEDYSAFELGSDTLVEKIIEDHLGWATSIAKAVAKAWNLDWQLDGLDGGAFEGLVFCAKRFDPSLKIPFRGYARRRIHEASTEEARKSKLWKSRTGSNSDAEQQAREISACLLGIMPELRESLITIEPDKNQDDSMRCAARQMIAGATLMAAFRDSLSENQENIAEFKRLLEQISKMEPVHQSIVFDVYWQGKSLRNIADGWGTDELAVIREHKSILEHLTECAEGIQDNSRRLKVRRALRIVALKMRKEDLPAPFDRFNKYSVVAILTFILLSQKGLSLFLL